MERKSEKHNPRLDDEMKHETESLVRGAPVEARAEEVGKTLEGVFQAGLDNLKKLYGGGT